MVYTNTTAAVLNRNYHTIIGFNGMLIAGGVLGILPPSVSAFLHNASTLMIGLNSMRPLDNKNNINYKCASTTTCTIKYRKRTCFKKKIWLKSL